MALFQFVLLPRQLARVFAQQKDFSAPFEIDLSDEGFELRSNFGSSRMPWRNFVKWKQNKELLLLYRSDYSFHMLPKRLLRNDSEVEYVLDKFRAYNVPVAGKVRNPVEMAVVVVLIVVAIVLSSSKQF